MGSDTKPSKTAALQDVLKRVRAAEKMYLVVWLVILGFFPAFSLLAGYGLIHFKEFVPTFAAVCFAYAIIFIATAQVHVAYYQMVQSEELANRKNDALMAAIASLTKELQRRPAPNPSVVNFSLFGDKR